MTVHARDELLLTRLGTVASAADPPPPLLRELGLAAWDLRRVDAELAELVGDSELDTAGVRGERPTSRLLSFDARGTAVEVEVSVSGGDRRLLGQVYPPPAANGRVRLELTRGDAGGAALDEAGCFCLEDAPQGLVRLHVEVAGVTTVSTQWVSL